MTLSRHRHVTAATLQGGELLSHVHRKASIWPHAHTEINATYIPYILKTLKDLKLEKNHATCPNGGQNQWQINGDESE